LNWQPSTDNHLHAFGVTRVSLNDLQKCVCRQPTGHKTKTHVSTCNR
jgi:hypothetical protein